MRARFEALLIRLGIYIFRGREVARCRVISRPDNKQLSAAAELIEDIPERIERGYR